jgi:hypothetical protein
MSRVCPPYAAQRQHDHDRDRHDADMINGIRRPYGQVGAVLSGHQVEIDVDSMIVSGF